MKNIFTIPVEDVQHMASLLIIYEKPKTFECVNCKAIYKIEVIHEGEKATLPSIEFLPIL